MAIQLSDSISTDQVQLYRLSPKVTESWIGKATKSMGVYASAEFRVTIRVQSPAGTGISASTAWLFSRLHSSSVRGTYYATLSVSASPAR